MALASNLISARVRAWTYDARKKREREREAGGNDRGGEKILGAVGYAGPISAAQLAMWAFGYTLLGLKPLASLLSNEIATSTLLQFCWRSPVITQPGPCKFQASKLIYKGVFLVPSDHKASITAFKGEKKRWCEVAEFTRPT